MEFSRALARALAAALALFPVSAFGQAAADEFHNSVSGSFVYGVKVGPYPNADQNKPGYSIGYAYRPLRWLEAEAEFTQIIHPVGRYDLAHFPQNANDQLYLAPFGLGFIAQPGNRRLKLTAGGGGVYLKHVGHADTMGFDPNDSGWGWQAAASGDYAISASGRFRLGLAARYLSAYTNNGVRNRMVTIGPRFTFSFH